MTLAVVHDREFGNIKHVGGSPGVFIGEVLAKQGGRFAKVFAINTTPGHITLTIQPGELEDVPVMPHNVICIT